MTLETLELYSGPADLGVMIQYYNDFCEECLSSYNEQLDTFIFDLKQSVGLEIWSEMFNITNPFYTVYHDFSWTSE